MKEKYVIITGTPGVGKSTVTKIITDKGWKTYNITDYVNNKSLFLGYDIKRDSLIIDEDALQELLLEETRNEELTILDGHAATLINNIYVKHCFVLRLNISLLNERLMTRGYIDTKIAENLQAEIMEVCLSEAYEVYGEKKVTPIDTSDKSPEEVASIIETSITEMI